MEDYDEPISDNYVYDVMSLYQEEDWNDSERIPHTHQDFNEEIARWAFTCSRVGAPPVLVPLERLKRAHAFANASIFFWRPGRGSNPRPPA